MKNRFRFLELKERGKMLARRFQNPNSSIHYLSILEGTTRGVVYVSEGGPNMSELAIVYSFLLGGFQIMGEPITEPYEYAALRLLFEREIINKLLIPNNISEVSFSCDSDALLEVMRIAFFDKEMYEQKQLCFRYSHSSSPKCFNICEYELKRLDSEFVNNNAWFPIELRDEILESFESIELFVKTGLGFAALDNYHIIANLIANANYENCFVLGADTDEEYRLRGIASSLLLTAVQYAHAHNCDLIWECAETNTASVKTVQKCGFELQHSFPVRWFEF